MTSLGPKISARRARYIKLGREGQWEAKGLQGGLLVFGYRGSHEDCVAGNWAAIQKERLAARGKKAPASNDVRQIREFYEAAGDTLWVTFHSDCLWWSFASSPVTCLSDGMKTRRTDNGWRNTDLAGNLLTADRIRGSLQSVQGYRGTICALDEEREYIVRKINGEVDQDVEKTRSLQQELVGAVQAMIKRLDPGDFELLVDLLFRQGGWQRTSILGKTLKTKDLELKSPLTDEKIVVQVKSRATWVQFQEYEGRLSELPGFARAYFVVHSPDSKLAEIGRQSELLEYWGPAEIASQVVKLGLTEWVIQKVE